MMKKLIKLLPAKAVTAMLAASALLLLSGTVGGARAALTYASDVYSSRIRLENIGVTLMEQGENDGEEWKAVSWRNYDENGNWEEPEVVKSGKVPELLTGMLKEGENPQIGRKYKEELKVRNTGDIGEYVRVTIYKYWAKEENGRLLKDLTLDPEVILLNLTNSQDWEVDADASTPERTVLYYRKLLPAAEKDGEFSETSCFMDSLTIDKKIVNMVTEEVTKNGEYTSIKSVYAYDGKQFRIEVEVDAVQEHNAEDAILSAWGRNVAIENQTLSLIY